MSSLARTAYPLLLSCIFILAACGSSSTITNPLTPSGIDRCQVGVSLGTPTAPAVGVNGSAAVTAARECSWSAVSDVTWITITGGKEGQGNGTVTYAVGANAEPAERSGAIAVNGQRAEIRQSAAPCRFEITPTVADVDAGGDMVPVRLATANGCRWEAKELGYGGAVAVAAAPHVTIAGELLLRRIGDLQTITPIAFPHPAIGGVNTIRLMPQGPARTTAVGVIGMKWNLAETWLLNASALLPLTNAGLNAKVVPMVTLDYGW